MLGFIESKYDVLEKREIIKDKIKFIYEIRKSKKKDLYSVEYISILGIKECNFSSIKENIVFDVLLFYKDNKGFKEKDWKTLFSDKVKYDDLLYYERIQDHHIGYTKNGGVCMY